MTSSRGLVPELPGSSPSALSGSAGDEKARARARVGLTINNKWHLDSLLGVGGMASVYGSTHRNGSKAALKILHTEFARDPGIRDRFLREGYVANKVDHPGRVAILDDDVTELDEPFLVMELLEGETVQQLWKRKGRKLVPVEALGIAVDLLDTLASFHAEGIVHRDLKPANVFVTKEGVVKLLDFGVARMRDAGSEHTRAGTALGTPSFMAPEQAMGLTDGVDGRADIFSVGATLFALMSGQRLHQGRSDNEAFILAATTPAPSLARVAPDLPVEVIALVDKALAWDKRSRFTDAAEMREESKKLIRALGGTLRGEGGGRYNAKEDAGRAVVEKVQELDEKQDELPLEASDPAVQRQIDIFRRIERLIPAVRHYGWAHPEADSKLRGTYQGIIEALRADAESLHFRLTPYAFTHRGPIVWEPPAPLDAVPYNLFAAGIRRVQITAGFTEDELKSFIAVMMLDPSHDLAPEDDVAAALWEKRLEHVRYDAINVFAEGDAADREAFWNEADDVEEMAKRATDDKMDRVEAAAAAIAISTDAGALAASRQAALALALDPVAKRALGAQMAINAERWSERFIDVLADAVLNARALGDLPFLLEPLDASSRELIMERKFDVVFGMWDALARALEAYAPKHMGPTIKAEVAMGMFSPETFRLLIREAVRLPAPAQMEQQAIKAIDLDKLVADLSPILLGLGAEHLPVALDLVPLVSHDELRQALLTFIERAMSGREPEVADRLVALDLEAARPLLKALATARRPGSLDALRRVAATGGAGHRCEATALLAASPEQLKDDLVALADNLDPAVRAAALRALAHHQVRAAGPLLVRRVQDPTFHQLTVDERREILAALFALHLSRAEALSIEILQKHSLLGTDDATEETRAICATLLGANSNSMEALEAVLGGLKRRWWNSQRLRDAAAPAADAIAARLGKRVSPAGDLIQ